MDGSQESGLNKNQCGFTHPNGGERGGGVGLLLGQVGTRRACWVHALISEASDSSGVSPVHRGLRCDTRYDSDPHPQTPRAAPVTDTRWT